ncbi:hypothetical protein TNCV_2952261 [Trichonephila clavipes]|nr:hypothetical protein TNCV_2952261 [Trichonephila clavipes]
MVVKFGWKAVSSGLFPSYTRAFGDGPRNFETWSSDMDDTCAGIPLAQLPHHREDNSALDRFKVHRCPTRRVFSGTGIELVTRQATVRLPRPLHTFIRRVPGTRYLPSNVRGIDH